MICRPHSRDFLQETAKPFYSKPAPSPQYRIIQEYQPFAFFHISSARQNRRIFFSLPKNILL